MTVVASDGSQRALRRSSIDATPPTVTGTINGTRSPEGWYGTPVTVTWACEDGTSQVASCPGPTTVTTQGANQTITSPPATDRAGNTATGSVHLSLDLGDPSSTIAGGLLAITLGRNAKIPGTASDALSGVRSVRVSYSPRLLGSPTTVNATLTCPNANRRSCTWTAPVPQVLGLYRATAVAHLTAPAATSP